MEPLRILLLADDPLARAGLAALLASNPDYLVVGQTGGENLFLTIADCQPDIIVWDVGWEFDENDERVPETAVPILVLVPDETAVPHLWAAGIPAILPREMDIEKIMAAAAALCQGLLVIDPELAADLLPAAPPPDYELAEDLTPREQEVLQSLAEGLTNRAIAQALGVSEHTIKFHVNAILTKLQAQSRTEAAVRATRLGLISL